MSDFHFHNTRAGEICRGLPAPRSCRCQAEVPGDRPELTISPFCCRGFDSGLWVGREFDHPAQTPGKSSGFESDHLALNPVWSYESPFEFDPVGVDRAPKVPRFVNAEHNFPTVLALLTTNGLSIRQPDVRDDAALSDAKVDVVALGGLALPTALDWFDPSGLSGADRTRQRKCAKQENENADDAITALFTRWGSSGAEHRATILSRTPQGEVREGRKDLRERGYRRSISPSVPGRLRAHPRGSSPKRTNTVGGKRWGSAETAEITGTKDREWARRRWP